MSVIPSKMKAKTLSVISEINNPKNKIIFVFTECMCSSLCPKPVVHKFTYGGPIWAFALFSTHWKSQSLPEAHINFPQIISKLPLNITSGYWQFVFVFQFHPNSDLDLNGLSLNISIIPGRRFILLSHITKQHCERLP